MKTHHRVVTRTANRRATQGFGSILVEYFRNPARHHRYAAPGKSIQAPTPHSLVNEPARPNLEGACLQIRSPSTHSVIGAGRRGFLSALLTIAGLLGMGSLAPAVASDAYPTRAIRFIIPYGTGGSPDVIARLIGQHVSESLKQPVIVENRPGANGIIAAQAVAKERPDGYTVLVADTGHLAINPNLYSNLPYDPLADFEPVKLAVTTPLFMAVRADLPVNSVAELVSYAQANPGKLSYASSGNGSPHHLGMEQFKLLTGTDMMHVPFKGVAESVPSLVAGRTDLMLVALSSINPHIQSGKIRVLGVGSLAKSALMPGVPPIADGGAPNFVALSRIGFVAPAGTPENRIHILADAITQALESPEIKEKMQAFGMEPVDIPRDAYAELIRTEIPQYGELIEKVGLKID